MPPSETLYLIDGHGQIFRAYFAIRGGMNSPVTGEPTNAVFGMAGMLLKFFLACQPTHAVMAIDLPGKTFRDDLYPEYKANRPPAPADLRAQENRIFDMVRLFGIPVLGLPGAEADDVVATLTHQTVMDPALTQVQIRIVSKDKDLEQLISDRVTMFDIHTDATIDAATLRRDKGITPAQVVDVLALMGDSVDNVPGVEGIGPKTAAELIHTYGSIDNLLAHLSELKGKRRENLEKSKDILALSRQLVTLKRDLALPMNFAQARIQSPDAAGLLRFFEEMGFRRHMSDLERFLRKQGQAPGAKGQAEDSRPASRPGLEGQAERAKANDFAGTLFDLHDEDSSASDTPAVNPVETVVHAPAALPPSDLSTRDYQAVTTLAQLRELCATLRRQTLIALDTETIGLSHRAQVCGISLAYQPGQAFYIPLHSPDPAQHLTPDGVRAELGPILADPAIAKCGHNIKYDWLVLRHAGIEVRGIRFDSMIASHLLGFPAHGLDHLALDLFQHRMMQISDLLGPDTRGKPGLLSRTMDQVPLDQITRYACDDAEVSLRLCLLLEPRLKLLGMDDLSRRVEMPLVEVLGDMEYRGITVDPTVLAQQKSALAARIDIVRAEIQQLVGHPFNLDSPKQLGEVLFTELKLPVGKRTKTGPSTDAETLEKLADREDVSRDQVRILELLGEYRQIAKLVSTYLDALRKSTNDATGRVHAQFHQTGAATGRLSSSDPNLQNIPIRTDLGRQIRKAFVAGPGHLLICADYSQIELRILAHLSGDPALREAFAHDQDIHAAVAAQVFNVPLEQVTKEQRGHAKTINFGIVYGVTPFGLARRIEGMTVEKARALIGDYKRKFAGIGTFLDRCIQQAEELGYVATLMGRRRAIPQITSRNPGVRGLGERLAINSVVQGSAADLIKLAMVNLRRRLLTEKHPAAILLQIHDELVIEAEAQAAPRVAEVVREEMESALQLSVPLKVDVGAGRNWLEAK